jgi:hypothetical protein
VIESYDTQVAVVHRAPVVAPSNRVLYWKGAVSVTFESIDVRAEPANPA